MRFTAALGIALLVLFPLASCGDRIPERAASTENSLPQWEKVLLSRIGSIDDPSQALTQVPRVVIGPSQEVYVSQPMEGEILVYDPDGSLLRRIGGRGEGPGEFSLVREIGFLGDTLFAVDMMQRRVSFFDEGGEFLSSVRWLAKEDPDLSGGFSLEGAVPEILLPDGSGLVRPMQRRSGPPPDQPGTHTITDRTPYVLMTQQFEVTDTVWMEQEYQLTFAEVQGMPMNLSCPLQDGRVSVLMRDGSGVVTVHRRTSSAGIASAVEVVKVSPRGDTVFVRSVPYAPQPFPASGRADLVNLAIDPYLGSNLPSPDPRAVEEILEKAGCFPDVYPPVSMVVSGQDGSLWLRREPSFADPVRWTVLGPQGAIQGEVLFPHDEWVVAARENIVVTQESDEYDVPYLNLYRIRR